MTRVLCCTVTRAGAAVAQRLPFEHRHGRLAETVRSEWAATDGFVLIGAAGIAVRAVAPCLSDKHSDPAVVCVDDSGRYAIPLIGGHRRGANSLAREVAALLGGEAILTTASDGPHGTGAVALDDLPGFDAEGDVPGLTSAWLAGKRPRVKVDAALSEWPLPPVLADGATGDEGGTVRVTDLAYPAASVSEVVLRPASLVVGVGASRGADATGLWDAVVGALAEMGLHPSAVGALATLDVKEDEPAVVETAARLGVTLRLFDATVLSEVEVPNPSRVVAEAVGTPSVAEAACLAGAGPDAVLVATKRVSATRDSTVAVARRRRPEGRLSLVGVGPGQPAWRTLAATTAIRHADTVIGYGPYVDLVSDLLHPSQRVVRAPIGAETERCSQALALAGRGERVALVCSGDPGVYAMASLAFELDEAPGTNDFPIEVVPGITAASSGAAVLGAPLGHDHAAISLSDLLTPWSVIARRLQAAADGDFVVSLYNPRSSRRTEQLRYAVAILAAHRPPSTPAAVLTDIGRPGQDIIRTTLTELDPELVTMRSLVVVGSSATRWIGDRMVTPRGYREPAK